jgi:valyl-tRNA synthetase
MVNWDPEAKTTLSDEEVILKKDKENYTFIQYMKDQKISLTIATTRPETIFDSVICINPK